MTHTYLIGVASCPYAFLPLRVAFLLRSTAPVASNILSIVIIKLFFFLLFLWVTAGSSRVGIGGVSALFHSPARHFSAKNKEKNRGSTWGRSAYPEFQGREKSVQKARTLADRGCGTLDQVLRLHEPLILNPYLHYFAENARTIQR